LSLFSQKREKRLFLREKKLKKISAPRAPPPGPSGGRPGRALRWGMACFAEVLLVFEDSLGPAPPVWAIIGSDTSVTYLQISPYLQIYRSVFVL